MRKTHCLPLILLALLVVAAGCQSTNTSRAQRRFTHSAGSFTDLAARSAYVDQRVEELTGRGLSKGDAAARASREWFSRAPAASETPTYYELKRRAAQTEFNSYLEEQKKSGTR